MAVGRLIARGLVGGLFIGHGTQKLFGWFGGHGLAGTSGFFDTLGLRPGRHHAAAAGISEAAGGALLVAGAATPLAGAMISGTMITAVRTVHWKNGPWVTNGGYEYNAVLVALLFMLVEAGPGPVSVDALLGRERKGLVWATLSLAAGAAGSAAALAYARRTAQADQAASQTEQAAEDGANPLVDADRERELREVV